MNTRLSSEPKFRQDTTVMTEYTITVHRWDGKEVVRTVAYRHAAAAIIRIAKNMELKYRVSTRSRVVLLGWYPVCTRCKVRTYIYTLEEERHCDQCCDCPEYPF